MTDKDKLEKLKKLADAMYYAANYLTTDASKLHKAMDKYHKFIIHEYKEEPVSEIDFEQELYKYFGQVKDFTLGMRIAKRFYEIGRNYQEPVSEDLGQAIDTYLATYWGGEKEKQDWPYLKKMAIHFAEWQKEQLMANAVDGVVHRFGECGVASVHYKDPNGVPMAYFISSDELSAGDKVKIITIKEG